MLDSGKFQKALLGWYRRNRRALPWRGERNPYRILVSEVMTQQTRVEQAVPYYVRFLEAFPTLDALRRASLQDVLKVWEGAGYYGRARSLRDLARRTAGHGLPETYEGLMALPGVGPYTAAAVGSIAFGLPVAAVDGNVRRVLSRLHALKAPSNRWVSETAHRLLPTRSPGDWNQAVMELGATVCVPRRPECARCPVRRFCRGRSDPARYPQPARRSQRAVVAAALVLVDPIGAFILERRQGRSLGGLWGVPLEEGSDGAEKLKRRYGFRRTEVIGTVRHLFTHKKLTVTVHFARTRRAGRDPARLPLSKLDRKILELARRFTARD